MHRITFFHPHTPSPNGGKPSSMNNNPLGLQDALIQDALIGALDRLVAPEPKYAPSLGDIVSVGFAGGEYDCATVSQVHADGTVDLFRPYTHTADFSYTGGVICYVGIETIKNANPARLRLIRKGSPLR